MAIIKAIREFAGKPGVFPPEPSLLPLPEDLMSSRDHLAELLERYPLLGACAPEISEAAALLCKVFRANGKALLCGNGGSAADAEHWSGELLKGFCSKRAINPASHPLLPEKFLGKLQYGLPAIPLTSFISLSTAFANDVSPELIFAQLVWSLGQEHDAFIGISTSGNAKNVCAAAETARAKGIRVISLTGIHGGLLAELADVSIRVPQEQTHLVQELHLPVYHAICLMVEEEFYGTELLG